MAQVHLGEALHTGHQQHVNRHQVVERKQDQGYVDEHASESKSRPFGLLGGKTGQRSYFGLRSSSVNQVGDNQHSHQDRSITIAPDRRTGGEVVTAERRVPHEVGRHVGGEAGSRPGHRHHQVIQS